MAAGTASYSLVLSFLDFDPTSRPSLPLSPLHPATPTLLPPALDRELRALQPALCLPRTFWQNLPTSRSLDTSDAPPTIPLVVPIPRRTWSDSSGARSPPPLPSPSLPTQEATLDFRFGPLSLDWVDYPHPRSPMSPPSPSIGTSTSSCPPTAGPSNLWRSTSPRISAVQLRRTPSAIDRPPEKAGSTDLYWGTVHLYRELGAEESTSKEKQSAMDNDDGTVVGMVAVPGNVTAAALLSFLSPALDSVMQLRVLRDSTPNRTMVLIRFREAADASEFKVMYNGKPYHDTKESEVCRVVSISSIKLKSSATPPFTFPYSPELEPTAKNAVELPTCPVCLERMDGSVTGLITVVCQHSFHCNCLLKWGDSRCPVCRSTNYRERSSSLSSPTASTCTICQSTSNLWICLICGNVGCGRYQGGHAHTHFAECGHAYSMELETQRVWDYVTDSYVHRLIRNRADGTLVELPSLGATKGDGEGKEKDKDNKGRGPDREDELEQDKLEAMGVEYAKLMTAQLEELMRYYEDEVARSKDELAVAVRRGEEEGARWKKERIEAEKKLDEALAGVAKERDALRAKLDHVAKVTAEDEARRKKERAEATKARKELERELDAERTVTSSLAENLAHLRGEMGKRDEELTALRLRMDETSEQMRDVMFALSARDQIEAEGGAASEAAGGDVSVPVVTPTAAMRRKKKR